MWILILIVGLVILLVIALQFPKVQHFAAQKGAYYLSGMLDTKVEIGGFTTDWRNALVLKNVYVEDQQQDTLWYSQRLGVDMRIFSLLSSELDISKIDLDHATLKLHIRPDSSTNFDFIMKAFAADITAQPADTAAATMKINVDVVNLNDVYVNFRDELAGSFVKTRIGELSTSMEELNLEEQRYLVDEIELRNTWVDFVQTKLPPETESEPIEFEFGLNRLQLQNIKVNYASHIADQHIKLALGESDLQVNNIDLPNARIELDKFTLHNTDFVYAQEKYKPSDSLSINPEKIAEDLDESVEKTKGEPANWVVTLGELEVSNLDAAVDNFNTPNKSPGLDYDHLLFSNVRISADDIAYSLENYSAKIKQLTLEEKSGLIVKNFQANVDVASTGAKLTNLDLQTGNSHLKQDLVMRYPSFEAFTENPEQVVIDINIQNSSVGMLDVQYFAPELVKDPSFKAISRSTLRIDGRAQGELDNLRIRNLQLAGLKDTYVDVSGIVRNVTDPDKMYLDLNIGRFTTTRTDILALTPDGTIPPEIRIPPEITLTGNYQGSLTAFDMNLELSTSFGNLTANVDMGPKETFTATVSSGGLDLGQVLTDSLGLGTVALEARANGSGLTPETMQANVQAQIQRLDYNNYTYNNIKVNADINRNIYDVKATANDQNLAFDLTGKFNLRDSLQPAYAFNMSLDTVNLQKLNFYSEPLAVQGKIEANFTGADANTLSGILQTENLVVRHNEINYPIDSLYMTLEQAGETAEILIRSDILAAEMHFENTLATLPTALQKHFSNYFDLQPDPPYPANLNLEDFKFTLDLKKTGLLASFVPGLAQIRSTDPITGSYNGETQQLEVNGFINSLTYTGYTMRNLDLRVRGNREQLQYNLTLQRLISQSLQIQNMVLEGAARDNDLTVRLAIAGRDTTQQEQFVIGGLLNSLGRGYRFSFNPDQLVINGDDWDVPQDNYLQFDTNLLYANNIQLQRGNSSLALNSTGPVAPNAPLQVSFNNIDIAYIMNTFQRQDSMFAGIINGEATLRNIMSGTPAFSSDLTVNDFAYEGTPVGDLALVANSSAGNRYNLEAKLTDNGNQVVIDGFIETQPNAMLLNLNANVANLNIGSLEGFTAGMVKDMDGDASGRLRITGTLERPSILGELLFDQAQFNISMLNSLYHLENERLVFNEQGISFPNFTITDSLGNDLLITGNIRTQDYIDYRFNLKATTDKFLAMNSTVQDNDLFYGSVFMAAEATITGDITTPVVRAQVRVLDNSNFTTVIPAAEVGAAEREGIVEFVNLNDSLTAIVGRKAEPDSTQFTAFLGADVEAEIRVTDDTPITIILDPITGDNLVVRGTASPLFIGVRPSGQINMSGRYTITDGRYSMDFYDLVSRELEIVEGSYIAWTGDPLLANMDITAIYTVETAPMELVASQIGGTTNPALRNQYPFQVFVYVDGELLKPEIGFNIEVPEEQRGKLPGAVSTSLGNLRQDESELNKQVFALLVLGRFLAPDPFTSSGGGLAATARNSISGVMTDQLNQLTNRYAGGLGLELGVNSYEDYSSGSAEGRTDLNVALRQQFLNDRLTVRVGTDIGIEGGQEQQQTSGRAASGFGGDISVEYSLTEDGRLRVQAFQRNQFQDFLEGDVRATGVSLIYMREYNNFSDLFRNLEKRHKREAERKLEAAEKLRTQK